MRVITVAPNPQNDSIILNRSSLERGMGANLMFHTRVGLRTQPAAHPPPGSMCIPIARRRTTNDGVRRSLSAVSPSRHSR